MTFFVASILAVVIGGALGLAVVLFGRIGVLEERRRQDPPQ